ncbi:translocation/assembly module TamB domain-containing protein [Anaeromyxobacter sp. SG64]|uniref:translocation/assembly module TamB domain-containing protein n=1 Tax=Anaeromyxobacter sp. SG64 TaxID=2925409 RepID=UPI001F5A48B3|nr:translocation/assembly module TamB domain-containing protein [Anaeromyxobacter sp. SG64]
MASGTSRSGEPRSTRRRRWLWRLGIGALSLVGVVLVLVLGALAYLATPAGGERLRRIVLEQANAAIEGTLTVRELSLRGGHLILQGVVLREPDGGIVARVSELEVRLRLAELVHKRIDVTLVRLDRPELQLRQDERGSNLQRAIAARNPTPEPEGESQKSSLGFVVEDLRIVHGVIDVVQRSPDASRHVHLDDLGASGSASLVGDALRAQLEITAGVAAPFEGPFHLSLHATGAGERKDARLGLELGTARLVAMAHVESETTADVQIESLVIPPEIADAFSPGYPLRADASLSAKAVRKGDALSLRLDARAASATVRADVTLDLVAKTLHEATVTVRHVDLSELFRGGPSSDVALNLVASGGGTSLEDMAGRLELTVPPSSMAGETMGPVRVLASANDGELQLSELLVNVPGLRIEARGQGRKERLALGGKLVARDLEAFGRTLGKLVGPGARSMKGRGSMGFAIGGSVEHPSITAHGGFPFLAYQKSTVAGLALDLNVPDLKAPTGVRTRLAARRLALSPGKVFRAVHLAVEGRRQDLTLDAAVHGYAELSLRAQATLSRDGRGGTLTALSLGYPEAQWSLVAPVRLESRAGLLSVSPLTLRSGQEAISFRMLKRGTKLDASLDLRSLDLGRLPKALVDPALAVGGVLDLEARVSGPSSKPEAKARVDLRGGRFKSYHDVELHLDASYAKDQAKGTLAANGEGIRLTGAFDVPVKALQEGRHVPVNVDIRMAELRLDESLRKLGIEKPISGLVSAEVSLRGTADDPRLKVALEGRRLRVKQLAASELDVVAKSADDGRLGLRVDLGMEGEKSFIELATPFTLGQLIRQPPTLTALMAAEVRLEADVREVPLKLLAEAGVSDRPLDGTLSARVHVTGSARTPRGEVSIRGRGLATRGVTPLDALLRLQLGDELQAEVRAERERKSIFTARARVRADPRQLQDRGRLAETPLSLEANLGPLSLSEVQAATQPVNEDPAQAPPRVRGTLTGRLGLSGTLHDPRLTLRMNVDGLGAESGPDGQVAVALDYAGAKELLDLSLRSKNGGALNVAATAHVDLSYPAVGRTERLDTAPVVATLQAKDFDPAFLSNLSGAVEKVGGLVYADARVSGTLGAPTVNGRLEWKDGLVFTRENGEFTKVHLLARGDNDRIELQDLSATAGGGTAKLSAQATRTGSKAFKLHAEAALDKFPVVTQGQVAATLSLRSTADGNVSPTDVTIRNLNIPEAHVVLPDVQRKDLQKLDDPLDVVLTMNGKPVRGTKRKAPAGASGETGLVASREAGTGSTGSGRAGTQLTVLVNAQRNLWVKGNDVNMELGFSDGFRIEYASEPKLFGDLNVIRGRLEVFGRRFDLQRDSKVSFKGPAMAPGLNVSAIYKNEIEQVTVHLDVRGEPSKLQLLPTSEPPLPETEIYTLLATGHTSLHRGTGKTSTSGEAASLVGSFAASQLKTTLSSKLPLDVLSIEAGDSGVAGTKLEAGTYVNDRFYVGFTGRIGADPTRGENSNQVDLEYQLSKRWNVNGSYGDARAGEASVNWQKEY